ncbi:guanine nucleotide exchange factor DBS isoform X2 [Parasteatoda tepidariorum]|uniref:guanine nucleotide exchange factor DBS isoform X2 n=1 Tax=Parasteatoda tepidariorum TaxID=114398 RepID=UPI0039BCE238
MASWLPWNWWIVNDEDGIQVQNETMEDAGCQLNVKDVAHLLRARHTIITGGRTTEGYPIIIFPDTGAFWSLSDEDYHKLILYLTNVPTLQDADLGFVLIIDRRNDKWSSVKTVLLKISGYFPGLIQVVFVLRPLGFLQKAISEVSNKFFREEFKFRLVICSNIDHLHQYIEVSQLTVDLGGTISYNHEEWIQQRVAVENFTTNLQDISASLRELTQRLQETEFPNDVQSTLSLLEDQGGEYQSLKEDIRCAAMHGETLLNCIRKPNLQNVIAVKCSDRFINAAAVQRLLLQLDETEKGFDSFWSQHEKRLSQCLELRKFEQEFKELQVTLAGNLRDLAEIPDTGDSVSEVDSLLEALEKFRSDTEADLDKADHLQQEGEKLIVANHYAVDSLAPKCIELERIAADIRQQVAFRIEILRKSRDLQARIEKANKWCTRGVNLLAGQQIEKYSSPVFAQSALKEIEYFLESSNEFNLNDPKEIHSLFKGVITPESRALVQQVLKRIEDVQMMCEKRKCSLQRIVSRNKGNAQESSLFSSGKSPEGRRKIVRKTKNVPKVKIEVRFGDQLQSEPNNLLQIPDGSSESRSPSPMTCQEMLHNKRSHVMTELIETEKAYVSELNSIIQGYKNEMSNAAAQVPSSLYGKADILFGNMEDIYSFHSNVFLKDLQACSSTPELVGHCFVNRRDAFHKLYSTYCLNKPKSEALRRQCGDDNPFFKECQKNLGHKLPLGAYLLKPVQRITKYQLLLKDLLKCLDEGTGQADLQEAVDAMLAVLKYVNDSMHQIAITGFYGSLADYGRLLLQSAFSVWMERKKRELRFKPRSRYIFLYEQLVLFTKKYGRDDNPSYAFKNALKTSQIGLTENIKGYRGDKRKFELWLHGRSQVFIIQAPSVEVKEVWVKEIKKVLLLQFEHLKDQNLKQHSDKIQNLGYINGICQSPPIPHRTRSNRSSFSWHNSVYRSNSMTTRQPGELGRRATVASLPSRKEDCVSDDGWSSADDFSSADEDDDGDVFVITTEVGGHYVALGDYEAVDVGEASLKEGETVEVEKVGCAGWWYVCVLDSTKRGWVPASYLGHGKSGSSPSVSSQDSITGCLLLAAGCKPSMTNTTLEKA